MAIVFAVRGNSQTAYYAGGAGIPATMGTASITNSTASGVIGGSYINLDQGALGVHALVYGGKNNFPAGQTLSILIRVATADTGSATQLFYMGGPAANWSQQARFSGAGVTVCTYTDTPAGGTLGTLNYTAGLTNQVFYDFVWLIDGTKTSGASILYRDGTAVQTAAGSGTRIALANAQGSFILLGAQNAVAQNSTRIWVNEFVIFDTIIDPTAVALADSTTASLNGSARTAFVQVAGGTQDAVQSPSMPYLGWPRLGY